MQFVVPDFIYKNWSSFCIGIWESWTEKADFDFVKFCNVIEWTLELNRGKEPCKWFDNATSIVQ